MKNIRGISREAVIWILALIVLAALDTGSTHFSLCPLKNAGIMICPGCGLGASVSHLLHGDIGRSFEAHPLGIFAVVVLSSRIINLTKQSLKRYGQSN